MCNSCSSFADIVGKYKKEKSIKLVFPDGEIVFLTKKIDIKYNTK